MKWRVNRAVKRSTLPPPSRLVMFVLSDRADAKTAVIPTEHSPSVSELAEETGLSEATMKRHLAALEAAGWVVRERPTAEQMARHVPGTYRLMIGKGGPNGNPGAQSEPPIEETGGSQRTPAGGSEEAPEIEPGAQSEPTGGSEWTPAGAQSEPPSYIDDRNDQNDQELSSSRTAAPPRDEQMAIDGTAGSQTEAAPAAKPKRARKPEPQRDDVDALCNRLAELMIANECKPPTITEEWRREARLLLDRDGRELKAALNLLEWSQKDPFWKGNIHSLPTFRVKYDQLRQKALAEWERARGASVVVPFQRNSHQPYHNPTDPNAYEGLLG